MKNFFTLLLFSPAFFAGAQTTLTFNYTGAVDTFIVPAFVTSVTVDVKGAEGGQAASSPQQTVNPTGKGGRVQATIPVTPGDTLFIYVGGKGGDASPNVAGTAGYNGGGAGGIYPSYNSSASGGGGGASDIRLNGITLGDRIVVAGGAGGNGTNCTSTSTGGSGGGLTGGTGALDCTNGNTAGTGGTQSAGGNPGLYTTGDPGLPGSLGLGANSNTVGYSTIGGAGGGGYYGGGSGSLGAGGGGSSYTGSSATNVVHTQGFQAGNGEVVITYTITGMETPVGGLVASVYPNPSQGLFDVVLNANGLEDVKMQVYDITGKPVYTFEEKVLGSFAKQTALDHLSNGVYYIRLVTNLGVVSGKIV
ncbi:MAG: T9SS type A sorting domain-containing protein, partial [Bacteroidota bacterium]